MLHRTHVKHKAALIKPLEVKCSAYAIISVHVHTRVDGYHTCDILSTRMPLQGNTVQPHPIGI